MGIRGVWRLFKDTFKNVQPVQLNSLKIGIDIFNLAYTYLFDTLFRLPKKMPAFIGCK